MGVFGLFGGTIVSVKSNYDSANSFVKSTENKINNSRRNVNVPNTKIDGLFNVTSDFKVKNDELKKKYEVSGKAVTGSFLTDLKDMANLESEINADKKDIDKEVKRIEEQFRQS